MEYGVGPDVCSQFDLTKKFTNLTSFQSLRCQLLLPIFFDLPGWILPQVVLVYKPFKVTSKSNETAVDRCNGLLTILA